MDEGIKNLEAALATLRKQNGDERFIAIVVARIEELKRGLQS